MSIATDTEKLVQYFIIYFEDALAQFPFEQVYDVRENWYKFRDLIKKKPIDFHEIHTFVKENMTGRERKEQASKPKLTIPLAQIDNSNHQENFRGLQSPTKSPLKRNRSQDKFDKLLYDEHKYENISADKKYFGVFDYHEPTKNFGLKIQPFKPADNEQDDELYSPDINEVRRQRAMDEPKSRGFTLNIKPVEANPEPSYGYTNYNKMNKITADELLTKNIANNKPLTKMFVQENVTPTFNLKLLGELAKEYIVIFKKNSRTLNAVSNLSYETETPCLNMAPNRFEGGFPNSTSGTNLHELTVPSGNPALKKVSIFMKNGDLRNVEDKLAHAPPSLFAKNKIVSIK